MGKWTLIRVTDNRLVKLYIYTEEDWYLYISHKIRGNPGPERNGLFKLSDLNDRDNIFESNMRAGRDNIKSQWILCSPDLNPSTQARRKSSCQWWLSSKEIIETTVWHGGGGEEEEWKKLSKLEKCISFSCIMDWNWRSNVRSIVGIEHKNFLNYIFFSFEVEWCAVRY